MRDLQERKRLRDILRSPVVATLLFIALLFLLEGNYGVFKKNQLAKAGRDESDQRLILLKKNRDRLTASLEKLKTGRGVEEELRDKFQITKSGEGVLIVVDQEELEQTKNKEVVNRVQGHWQKLKYLLGL